MQLFRFTPYTCIATMATRRQCGYIVIVLVGLLFFFARPRASLDLTDLSMSQSFRLSRFIQRQSTDHQVAPQGVSKAATMNAFQRTSASNGSESTWEILLTLVISAPGNKARRDAIRETWKNSYVEPGKQFNVRFVMGTLGVSDKDKEALFAENEKYNDLVLLTDHLDSYNNLTRKVLHMFMWADRNVNYSYLLKADDDSFARLDVLESILEARSDPRPLYWGYLAQGAWPQKEGKWKEENWDISEKYLPYAFGGGYVLSADLIHRIAVNADGLIMYANEDVSVGAWVSPFDLERKHDSRFAVTRPSNRKWQCKESQLLKHYQTVKTINARHKQLLSNGTLCEYTHTHKELDVPLETP